MKISQFIKHLCRLESPLNWAINVVLAADWDAEYLWKCTTTVTGISSTELITKRLRNISRKRHAVEFLFFLWLKVFIK